MEDIKFIDLFAGIGGFHQAMLKVKKDSKCVLVSEIEPHAIKFYNKQYKNAYQKKIQNIRDIKSDDVPDHDFLFAGFPCQAFSSAGKKEGFMDKVRGTLFFEVARILKHKKPKYAILENVKHLVKHNDGKTFQTIINTIEKLEYVTTKDPLILSPHQFGIPQNRERVYIVLIREELVKEKKLKFDFSNDYKKVIKYEKYLEKTIDDKYYIKDKYMINAFTAWEEFIKNVKRPKNRTLPVVWTDEFGKNYSLKKLSSWRAKYISDMRLLYLENKTYIDKWMKKYNVKSWRKREKKLEWQAGINNFDMKNSFIQLRQSGIRCRKKIMFPTLVAMVQVPIIYDYKGWRQLTPKENANIQCFPKDFKPYSIDHEAYKQFGNSVNVYVVAKLLDKVIKQYGKQ